LAASHAEPRGIPMQDAQFASTPASPWLKDRPVPLDFAGPADVPFDPGVARLIERSGGVAAIEAAAERLPDKIVVDDGSLRLSYAEFLDRVYGLVERLRGTVRPGAVVASLVHNSAASPVIIMASCMAGCVLVPIDASHPVERQVPILRESGAELLILRRGEA